MKKFNSILFVSVCFFFAVLMNSCEKDNADNDIEELQTENQIIPKRIINKLVKLGFATEEGLSLFEDGYLVENDILLTENQIDKLLLSQVNGDNTQKQYRTNNLVNGTRTLSVFMDPAFGSFMQNAFNDAIGRYNAMNLRLNFTRTNNAITNDIEIIAFFENSDVLGISAGFPVNGNPANTIKLNTRYYNDSSRRADAATTIAHEIGHAIGFRHTDFMNRSFSCGGNAVNEGTAGVGANLINGTPSGPVSNSWMLACSNNTNRPFVLSDEIALYNIYGRNTLGSLFFRYYNSGNGDHFYTTNFAELGDGKSGYTAEGIQCRILSSNISGTLPFYRYYNSGNGDHFYTSNYAELGGGGGGYIYEGIAGYIYASSATGRIPLYRYYNPGNGDHFYTTNFSELSGGGGGYIYEGIAGYVIPK